MTIKVNLTSRTIFDIKEIIKFLTSDKSVDFSDLIMHMQAHWNCSRDLAVYNLRELERECIIETSVEVD